MQNAFKDMATFLSAWLIYISVRSSYVPERGPGLVFWTERVIFYAQSGFAWSTVLNYIIAYFLKHQNSPLVDWYEVDSNLVAIHFSIARRNPIPGDGGDILGFLFPREETKFDVILSPSYPRTNLAEFQPS